MTENVFFIYATSINKNFRTTQEQEAKKKKKKKKWILKSVLPLKMGDGLPVFTLETIYHVRTEMRHTLVI